MGRLTVVPKPLLAFKHLSLAAGKIGLQCRNGLLQLRYLTHEIVSRHTFPHFLGELTYASLLGASARQIFFLVRLMRVSGKRMAVAPV